MTKALTASAAREATVGHPDFDALELGAVGACSLAIAFIDITNFTARSFWEPLADVTRLAMNVLTQVAIIVEASGGYVLGLRGDGVMAGWGRTGSDAKVDVAMCVAACAVSLDAVDGALRGLLELDGIEPVQVRAGVDWGSVTFTRTGTPLQSEVNVVGHPANFAAKCEKTAKSWEVVIGEGASQHVESKLLLHTHADSPKRYQYRGNQRTYAFSDFSWRSILTQAVTAIEQMNGASTSSVHVEF